jgi:tetratricopeptide (TPR) repeat protein
MSDPPGPDDPAFAATYRAMIEHDRERAVAELEALVAAKPTCAPAWAMLMLAHHRRLDFVSGTAATEALLALDPTHHEGLQQLAFNLTSCGTYGRAVTAYRRAHAVTRSPLSAYMVAVLLHRLGRLEEAAQAYGAILAASDPAGLEVLGILRGVMNLLRDQGQPLAADRFAHMLNLRYRQNPVLVSSFLVDRDQSSPFHEWLGLVDKATLGAVLRRGLAAEPGVARVPETFNLPAERDALMRYAASEPDTLYIVKPARGSGGQGIHVTGDVTALAGLSDVVVQRYISNPWLIDGCKGHLRIYALITQAAPLRAYIYREGIVRIAPEPYDLSPDRLADVAMHVTNTALHLDHPGLMISQDETRDDEGAIRSLSALLRRMAAEGYDPDVVFGEIRSLVAWFLRQLEREGFFARQAALGSTRSFGPKLIGFDILLDADGHPWLIELQSNPAAKGAPLVNKINAEMFANIFRMSVGVLAEDSLSDADLAALRSDPAALAAAELAHETRRSALFSSLWD